MRVVVVDDNDVWRPSLVSALMSRGITVVADTADGDELLAMLPTLDGEPISVAILDLRLPTRLLWDQGAGCASAGVAGLCCFLACPAGPAPLAARGLSAVLAQAGPAVGSGGGAVAAGTPAP